jgi:hypothetical protein
MYAIAWVLRAGTDLGRSQAKTLADMDVVSAAALAAVVAAIGEAAASLSIEVPKKSRQGGLAAGILIICSMGGEKPGSSTGSKPTPGG